MCDKNFKIVPYVEAIFHVLRFGGSVSLACSEIELVPSGRISVMDGCPSAITEVNVTQDAYTGPRIERDNDPLS
jgi:hypothetical protein